MKKEVKVDLKKLLCIYGFENYIVHMHADTAGHAASYMMELEVAVCHILHRYLYT